MFFFYFTGCLRLGFSLSGDCTGLIFPDLLGEGGGSIIFVVMSVVFSCFVLFLAIVLVFLVSQRWYPVPRRGCVGPSACRWLSICACELEVTTGLAQI